MFVHGVAWRKRRPHVDAVGRPVHHDPVEVESGDAPIDDDVDRIVEGAFDTPEQGRSPV